MLGIIKMEQASAALRLSVGLESLGSARRLVRGRGKSQLRAVRRSQVCTASMGIGFTQESSGLALPSKRLLETSPEYGLTAKQMQVLGLSNEAMTKLPEVEAVSGHALSFYMCSSYYFCQSCLLIMVSNVSIRRLL